MMFVSVDIVFVQRAYEESRVQAALKRAAATQLRRQKQLAAIAAVTLEQNGASGHTMSEHMVDSRVTICVESNGVVSDGGSDNNRGNAMDIMFESSGQPIESSESDVRALPTSYSILSEAQQNRILSDGSKLFVRSIEAEPALLSKGSVKETVLLVSPSSRPPLYHNI
jgi:hypothetical protein